MSGEKAYVHCCYSPAIPSSLIPTSFHIPTSANSHSLSLELIFNMTLVWVLLLAAISSVMAQSCYSMDGSVLDDRYKPCYPKAGSTGSGCCMLNVRVLDPSLS